MAEQKNVEVKAEPRRQEPEEATLTPLVDVYEREDRTVVLEVELPGASPDDIDLRVEKGVLTIDAQMSVPEPGEEYSVTYRGFEPGRYWRAFALSDEVDREKIDASFANGVMTITLPRAAAAETKKIEIKSG